MQKPDPNNNIYKFFPKSIGTKHLAILNLNLKRSLWNIFEGINYAADGGLYAELIQKQVFEYSPTDRNGMEPFFFLRVGNMSQLVFPMDLFRLRQTNLFIQTILITSIFRSSISAVFKLNRHLKTQRLDIILPCRN